MATWQPEDEPTDDTSVILTLLGEPEVVELPSDALDPQLVVMVFIVCSAKHPDKRGLLISGNLHIRTPSLHKTTMTTRRRIAKAALQALEKAALQALEQRA